MSSGDVLHRLSRRDLLKLGGVGALSLAGVGAWAGAAGGKPAARTAPVAKQAAAATVAMRLAATDGHIALPGRPNYPDPDLYVFGFIEVPVGAPIASLDPFKGNVQVSAPTIGVDEEDDFYLTVTNLGLVVRPDLDDSHTVHWHGFPNATAIFDGVPEVSIAVPPGRDFPYYYKPHRAGTFIYHCHFEDVEHVQMGMQGIVFVRPAQNAGPPVGGFSKFAYNDGGDGSTGYNREFAMLLNEVWWAPHDNLEAIQETVWPFYKADSWTINGRSYPDTVKANDHPDLPSQPNSSLVQVNPGERVLLRLADLGYDQHAMQLPGIPMKVVGEDAALLRNGAVDLSYMTNTVYVGPGEARDVLFTAPAFDPLAPTGFDAGVGTYNRYYLRNRNPVATTNAGLPGLGGMVTEVRVYQGSPLPPQTAPNQTFPV